MITRRTFTTGAATMLAAGHLSTRAMAATANWDMSTVWPDANFHTQNAMAFAEEVRKQSDGGINITVKAGGQLGFKGPEHLRAVRDGLVPLADVLNIQQVGDEPFMGVESIPFLAGSMDELKVLHKYVRPEYEKITARNNQKILYVVPWPTQYLHLKVKVSTVEGLKNIKIRVPDKGGVDTLGALGMAPIMIPWGETIPALASGAVAGVATSAVSGVDGKFWEFMKYIHPTNHVWSSQMLTVNLESWKALGADQQKLVADVAAKMEPGCLGELAQGRRRQSQPPQGGRHGGDAGAGRDDDGDSRPDRTAARRLPQTCAGGGQAGKGLSCRNEALGAWP
ncbi:TRAP-type C4-dicarboxylate transport system substrate-binding protein [Nitrobacteraceae bacterium AZCC 2146]